MKIRLTVLTILLVTIGVLARVIAPFPGWTQLEELSSDIVIVSCGNPTPPASGVTIIGATKSDSEVEILSVLKGTNNISSARLQTDHELQKGQGYLVFGHYENGVYEAWEEYKVLPLGINIPFNSLKDKTLDEQLRILFQVSIDNVNHKIQKDEEEKQRLEEFPLK